MGMQGAQQQAYSSPKINEPRESNKSQYGRKRQCKTEGCEIILAAKKVRKGL